jgi:hypothetical protein
MTGRRRYATLLAGATAAALALAGPARSGHLSLPSTDVAAREGQTVAATSVDQVVEGSVAGPCSGVHRLPAVTKTKGLPWPATLRTTCGRFLVQMDGSLVSLPVPFQPVWTYRIPTGIAAWAEVVQGHVIFEDRGRLVWRSSGSSFDPQDLASAVAGPGWVAFSIYTVRGSSELYVSYATGSESKIGENEDPIALAIDGRLVVSRWTSDGSEPDLLALDPDGTLARTLALEVPSITADPRSGTVLYFDLGALWRTDGMRSWSLVRFHDLGLGRIVNLTPLADGRLVLTGPERIALLGSDGKIISVGSPAAIPRGGWGFVSVWPDQSPDPATGALVFVATNWKDASMGGGSGWEGVYSLAPGDSAPQLLFGKRLSIAVCAHSASLSWHGRWLLYGACEGRAIAIDTTGRHAPIDLSAVARSLPIPPDEREYGLWGAEWAPFDSLGRQVQV